MPQTKIMELFKRHAIWLSLLLHSLIFLSFSLATNWLPQLSKEDPPSMYVPSYVYQPSPTMPNPVPTTAKDTAAAQPVQQTEDLALEKEKQVSEANKPVQTSQARESGAKPPLEETEPINLVGEQKTPKPLIELLGKALAKRLKFPKIAADFHLHGMAAIGFVIHPDGSITDVRLVRSSGADVLDEASIQGIRAISPVKNAGLYVKEDQYLVAGIIWK